MVEIDQTDPFCVLKAGVSVKQLPPLEKALPFVTNCPNEVIVEITKSVKASVTRMRRMYEF